MTITRRVVIDGKVIAVIGNEHSQIGTAHSQISGHLSLVGKVTPTPRTALITQLISWENYTMNH